MQRQPSKMQLLGKSPMDKDDKNKLNFMQKSIRKIINTFDKMDQKTKKCISKVSTLTKTSVKNDIQQLKENTKSKGYRSQKKEQSR